VESPKLIVLNPTSQPPPVWLEAAVGCRLVVSETLAPEALVFPTFSDEAFFGKSLPGPPSPGFALCDPESVCPKRLTPCTLWWGMTDYASVYDDKRTRGRKSQNMGLAKRWTLCAIHIRQKWFGRLGQYPTPPPKYNLFSLFW